jgi:hypothetical protein
MENENKIYKKRFLYVAALIIILWFALIFPSRCNAQVNYCDQLSYSTYQYLGTQGLNVTGNATSLYSTGLVDTIIWNWQACNSTLCYSGYGQIVNFPNILTTDTIKLCYDVLVNFADTTLNGYGVICSNCDSLIFSGGSWVLLTNTPTSINEFTQQKINDNKIYDLLGRELKEVPVGTIYIRNKKLYITK